MGSPESLAMDGYSFAITCYEILTGGVPFAGMSSLLYSLPKHFVG
jgi:serine/threonine protein kinase